MTQEMSQQIDRQSFASLVVPFALSVLGLKLGLVLSRSTAGWLESATYLLPEVLLCFLAAGVAALLFRFGRAAGRSLALSVLGTAVLLQVLCFLLMVKSGSTLDWGLCVFAVGHLDELGAVLVSELRWYDVALLAVPVAVVLVPLAVRRSAARRGLRTVAAPMPAPLLAVAFVLWAAGLGLSATPRDPELAVALLRPLVPLGPWAPVEVTAAAEGAGYDALLPDPDRLFAAWRERPATAPRPNFIVIGMESVRASATTPYEPSLPTTPFLADLAQRSLLFERAYAVTPNTSKSLLAMFTGHPPEPTVAASEAGRLPAGGIPARLAQIGYRTAFFEPSTEFYENRRLLLEDLGFAEYYPGETLDQSFQRVNYFGLEDRAVVGPMIRWLEQDRSRPFLLATINVATHHPYVFPKGFPRTEYPLADPPPAARDLQRYLNCIRYFDGVLEDLFARLEAGGFLRDTVVFLVGDHGQAFGEHGRMQHGGVPYEEVMRVPLIVHGPEALLGPPRRVAGLRQVIDIGATLADLVGVPGMQDYRSPLLGMSLRAAAPRQREIHMFAHLGAKQFARLRADEKMIYDVGFDRLRCFRLSLDPGERTDLRGTMSDGAARATVEDMLATHRALGAWYQRADEAELEGLAGRQRPDVGRPIDAVFGAGLRLLGIDAADSVPLNGYLDVRLCFEVLEDAADELRLELRTVQFQRMREAHCARDPNRLPVDRWRRGEFVTLPLRVYLNQQLVREGEASLELAVVDRSGDPVPVLRAGADRARAGYLELLRFRVTNDRDRSRLFR